MDIGNYLELTIKVEPEDSLPLPTVSPEGSGLVGRDAAADKNPRCLGTYIEVKTEPEEHCESGEAAVKYPYINSTVNKYNSSKRETNKIAVNVKPKEKRFRCNECGKDFCEKSYLKKHLRIHTGEKPFTCSKCPRTFVQSGHLREHMKTHTGEKPYSCQQCLRAFSSSANLKKHIRLHTGEKPYTCPQCPSAYSDPTSLRRHLKTHMETQAASGSRTGVFQGYNLPPEKLSALRVGIDTDNYNFKKDCL